MLFVKITLKRILFEYDNGTTFLVKDLLSDRKKTSNYIDLHVT